MSKKVTKQSKLSRYLKASIRVLTKARDLYIKSMTEYSERIGYGAVMGCPTGQVHGLSRSYSVGSTKPINGDDDLRELIRAASTRRLRNKGQLDLHRGQQQQQQQRRSPKTGANHMPRSHSVVMGRIDEDKPCNFEGEDHIKVKTGVFLRSGSSAVTNKKDVYF